MNSHKDQTEILKDHSRRPVLIKAHRWLAMRWPWIKDNFNMIIQIQSNANTNTNTADTWDHSRSKRKKLLRTSFDQSPPVTGLRWPWMGKLLSLPFCILLELSPTLHSNAFKCTTLHPLHYITHPPRTQSCSALPQTSAMQCISAQCITVQCNIPLTQSSTALY